MTVPDDYLQQLWESVVLHDLFGSAHPDDHPVFLDVGGQPGSGKSRGAEGAAKLLYPDLRFVRIDLDALREYHPGFRWFGRHERVHDRPRPVPLMLRRRGRQQRLTHSLPRDTEPPGDLPPRQPLKLA